MDLIEFRTQVNDWAKNGIPFLFIIDYELEEPVVLKLSQLSPELFFKVGTFTNVSEKNTSIESLVKVPIPFSEYRTKFDKVLQHLTRGDSFLTNLTIKTRIESTGTLEEIYHASYARYKLLIKGKFLVFSPETFIQIRDGKIFSYPMKGTIDANIPDAEAVILNDQKEKAEHVTIVDLIRNDLSMVAQDVSVTKFRYIDKIKTSDKDLLQVSSEITGTLPDDWSSRLGDILISLLPAGSISGAPKQKTIEIIAEAEQEKRGYYTGVFGYFDGQSLDSGVMIRFIEKVGNQLYYRSGGGITTQSDAKTEYQEAIDKVYVPIT